MTGLQYTDLALLSIAGTVALASIVVVSAAAATSGARGGQSEGTGALPGTDSGGAPAAAGAFQFMSPALLDEAEIEVPSVFGAVPSVEFPDDPPSTSSLYDFKLEPVSQQSSRIVFRASTEDPPTSFVTEIARDVPADPSAIAMFLVGGLPGYIGRGQFGFTVARREVGSPEFASVGISSEITSTPGIAQDGDLLWILSRVGPESLRLAKWDAREPEFRDQQTSLVPATASNVFTVGVSVPENNGRVNPIAITAFGPASRSVGGGLFFTTYAHDGSTVVSQQTLSVGKTLFQQTFLNAVKAVSPLLFLEDEGSLALVVADTNRRQLLFSAQARAPSLFGPPTVLTSDSVDSQPEAIHACYFGGSIHIATRYRQPFVSPARSVVVYHRVAGGKLTNSRAIGTFESGDVRNTSAALVVPYKPPGQDAVPAVVTSVKFKTGEPTQIMCYIATDRQGTDFYPPSPLETVDAAFSVDRIGAVSDGKRTFIMFSMLGDAQRFTLALPPIGEIDARWSLQGP